jgi:hypothetical protein
MAFYGILWHFMAFYGILWHFMAFYGILWHFEAFCGIFGILFTQLLLVQKEKKIFALYSFFKSLMSLVYLSQILGRMARAHPSGAAISVMHVPRPYF